ncbi:MAG: 2-hydroxyacyl-CoA dehydratase family protein [Anaerolineae bacterium]|jgi:bcr-type benzoyl-CoA reductase subunit C
MSQEVESLALSTLAQAARAPLDGWPDRNPGHRAMGYLCSYVPEEVIHAAGFVPVRLRGSNDPLRRVDAHLQSFTCALCRSTLDQALTGKLRFLAGTVFAHTCDAMQALADLWRMNTEFSHFVDTVMQPANLSTPAARPYLTAELHRFRERLAAFAKKPISDDDLRNSIALYDESRRLVGVLQGLRDRMSASHFYAVLDAVQVMPRETANPLLSELATEIEMAAVPVRTSGPRLFLVGAVVDEPRLLELIDELGGRVTGDDLCSGSRHFRDRIGTQGEPLANLADYYLRRPPCPTKLHGDYDPSRYLLDQVHEVEADGIVFVVEKFCEPHAFDYALVLPALDKVGLPHLLLEMEQTPSMEALRTRLQAFLEIL